jgi:hypothetical protein
MTASIQRSREIRPLALWLVAGLMSGTSAGAATYLVRPDGSGAFPTIQAAVDAVALGDTIAMADGTFRGAGNRDIDFAGKDLVVRSQSGNAAQCIIDCQGTQTEPHRGYNFHSWESADAVVEGITICNGWGPDDLYGMSEGGAIRCDFALPTLQDCIFSDNRAIFGAAIMLTGPSRPLIRRCTFTGNEAQLDGACIDCEGTSAPLVWDCLLQGNTSGHRAGGILADEYASPVFSVCTFVNNYGADGGGAASGCGSADPLFRRCTFVGNSAGANGAGVSCSCSADAFLESCVIAFSASGPAVTCLNEATVTLTCCDLFGNAGGDWVGPIANQFGVNGNFGEDPLFCNLPAGNLHLDGASPCLPRNHPQGAQCGVLGAWGVGCPGTGVDPQVGPAARLQLDRPRPNPSAGGVTFRFDLPGDDTAESRAPAAFCIYDAAGRLVETLLQGPLDAGAHVVRWDGRDPSGQPAPAGVYFGRLQWGDQVLARAFLRAR